MEWRRERRGFRSGREGEEVFDLEGDERRREEEGFDCGGRELFLNGKSQIFWLFCFSYFLKNFNDK